MCRLSSRLSGRLSCRSCNSGKDDLCRGHSGVGLRVVVVDEEGSSDSIHVDGSLGPKVIPEQSLADLIPGSILLLALGARLVPETKPGGNTICGHVAHSSAAM